MSGHPLLQRYAWVPVGLALGITAYLTLGPRTQASAQDACPAAPVGSTVIVLDRGALTARQTRHEVMARALNHVGQQVRPGERVSVFTVSDASRRALAPLVSLCRPAESPRAPSTAEASTAQRRFQEQFATSLLAALDAAPHAVGDVSVAQVLTDLSLSNYLGTPRNELLVFSDMAENTPRFSLLRCTASDNVLARYRQSRSGAQERPVFHNTRVQVHLVPRLDQPLAFPKCRTVLWTWFFGNNDGPQAGLEFTYLPGEY